MDSRRKRGFTGQVIGHEPDSHLTLTVRLLINRGSDSALFEIGRHLSEEIRCYQFCFSRKAASAEGPAHWKAVDCIDVNSGEARNAAQKIKCLLKTLVFVLMSFDHADNLAPGTVSRKCVGKPRGFSPVILGAQHARNHSHFGAWRHKFTH